MTDRFDAALRNAKMMIPLGGFITGLERAGAVFWLGEALKAFEALYGESAPARTMLTDLEERFSKLQAHSV